MKEKALKALEKRKGFVRTFCLMVGDGMTGAAARERVLDSGLYSHRTLPDGRSLVYNITETEAVSIAEDFKCSSMVLVRRVFGGRVRMKLFKRPDGRSLKEVEGRLIYREEALKSFLDAFEFRFSLELPFDSFADPATREPERTPDEEAALAFVRDSVDASKCARFHYSARGHAREALAALP